MIEVGIAKFEKEVDLSSYMGEVIIDGIPFWKVSFASAEKEIMTHDNLILSSKINPPENIKEICSKSKCYIIEDKVYTYKEKRAGYNYIIFDDKYYFSSFYDYGKVLSLKMLGVDVLYSNHHVFGVAKTKQAVLHSYRNEHGFKARFTHLPTGTSFHLDKIVSFNATEDWAITEINGWRLRYPLRLLHEPETYPEGLFTQRRYWVYKHYLIMANDYIEYAIDTKFGIVYKAVGKPTSLIIGDGLPLTVKKRIKNYLEMIQ